MAMEMKSIAICDWCGHKDVLPAKKVLLFNCWRPAKYPENWICIKEAMICDDCRREYDKTVDELARKRANGKTKAMA